MPQARVRTSAWPASGTGSAMVSTTRAPARRMTARTALFRRFGLLQAHHGGDLGTDVLQALLLDMLGDARSDRGHGRSGELGLVAADPGHGGGAVLVQLLEFRGHVAGEQL